MKSYRSETQKKNIAWFLPRPKPDRYKGGMPLYCEEWLLDLARDILSKKDINILNLFCGMNKYGVRVDINPEVNPDLCCDVHNLDMSNKCSFDVIIADPPYSNDESKEMYGTGKLNYNTWTFNVLKYLKPGGLFIIYHKFIMPNPNPEEFKVIKRIFVGNRTYHTPRIAIYFQKRKT